MSVIAQLIVVLVLSESLSKQSLLESRRRSLFAENAVQIMSTFCTRTQSSAHSLLAS